MHAASTIIAVPTFRRPEQLRHLIAAIARLDALDDAALLVADNGGGEGAVVAAAMAEQGLPLPVEVIHVPEPGLCHARNAIVAHALAIPSMQRLAMLDDDEWPEPQWLAALLAVQRRTNAAVVGGPVIPVFPQGAPDWVEQTLVFRPEQRTEGPTGMLYASNNLLVMRTALEALGAPWFDPAFNRSGGEDLDFLTRLQAIGFRFAWAPGARVSEWVGAERARKAWVLRRMWRIGVTDTRVARKQRRGLVGHIVLGLRSLALLGLRTAALPAMLWRQKRRLDIAGQWVKAVARLYALAGGSDALYAAPAPLSSARRGSS
ncbi:GT2 family glycosyltransferase [Sphingomonas naasensis]|uniref:Glycosyltransferase n=1 Tax=Sphingomonas naasensis TaxID=1344951 RepID=A0A4S1WSM2_9SPHN|nr:glycosyltransferase [Sphingomonas naasensis]NIJ19222.1 GT2 family glycosyltransferase [Sphingomonas naasensis]TGX46404.1 glycosyltransferase [Sphingomonas naasensis]